MCRNDELSWLFTKDSRLPDFMKVRRMGITEILRRIWLFSANKIKSSDSGSKQSTQLIIVANNCHTYYIILVRDMNIFEYYFRNPDHF
jgi:hypothetical protein